jgi:hypothetical protein
MAIWLSVVAWLFFEDVCGGKGNVCANETYFASCAFAAYVILLMHPSFANLVLLHIFVFVFVFVLCLYAHISGRL